VLSADVTGSQGAQVRFERAAAAAVLVMRAGYCLYAVGVVGLNLSQFEKPALVQAMVALALAGSTLLGLVVFQQGAVTSWLSIADAFIAALVLTGVSLALAPDQRAGSLNWALAYSVGCAIWLGFSRRLWLGMALATVLSAVYLQSALGWTPNPEPALKVTAAVNAVSPLLYFGLAAMAFRLIRTLAIRTDQLHSRDKRQRRDVAELAERERIFREVHEPVTEALRLVADVGADEREARRLARLGVVRLRRTLDLLGRAVPRSGLRTRLDDWAASRAGFGQLLDFTDEEMSVEPSTNVIEALAAALETLIPKDHQATSRVHVRLASDESRVEVGVRLEGETHQYAPAIEQVRTLLAPVTGTIELRRALQKEVRVVLTAPLR
jgi:hypothetical protein